MKAILILTALLGIVIACSPSESSADSSSLSRGGSMTMAEVSELAQVMKDMHKDAKNWRKALIGNEMVLAENEIFTKLTESTPTNKNVQGPAFEGFSMHYQEQLNSFLAAADLDQAKGRYNNLVSACVQCHQAYCTGPIPTIEKLYLPKV